MNISKRSLLQWLAVSSISASCSSNTSIDPPDIGMDSNPDTDDTTDIADNNPPAGSPVWTVNGIEVPELSSFDTTMQSFMQARNIPGGSLAVTRGSKLSLARGYNFAPDSSNSDVKPTSLFRIASISKTITGTAIMRLVQDGQLDLTGRLGDFLTLTPPANQTADPRLADVTVRHLLQHLAGWNRQNTFDPMFSDLQIADSLGISLPVSMDSIATYMMGQPLQSTPGAQFAYSNFGYSLLGKIIKVASGLSYQDYVNQMVLSPLNITRPRLGRTLRQFQLDNEVNYHPIYDGSSVFDRSGTQVPSPYGAFNIENMDAHGGWLASAVDLVRFASTFDNSSVSPVLNQPSIDSMFSLPENVLSADYEPGSYYYANGWEVRDYGNGMRNTWHGGSLPGTSTLLVRRRDGLNWCVLFNQRDDASGLSYADIDGLLHSAANSVAEWPNHDLFDTYL